MKFDRSNREADKCGEGSRPEINECKTKSVVLNEQQEGRGANLVVDAENGKRYHFERVANFNQLGVTLTESGKEETERRKEERNREKNKEETERYSGKKNKGREMLGGFGADTKSQEHNKTSSTLFNKVYSQYLRMVTLKMRDVFFYKNTTDSLQNYSLILRLKTHTYNY